MNYKFQNLLGGSYRGGNLVLRDKELHSATGNRIVLTDLVDTSSRTLQFESSKQVAVICTSPDGGFIMAIDEDGRSLLINKKQSVLLHRFSFKGPVRAAEFSPDGQFIACAVGKVLQVWRAPGLRKAFAPMELYRTYGGCHADIASLDWSTDSFWIAVASKDLTARVFSLNPIEGYSAPTLGGHKETLVAAYFAGKKVAEDARLTRDDLPALYTLSRDGALFSWTYQHGDEVGHTRKKQRRGRAPAAVAEDREGPAAEAEAAEDSVEDGRQAAFSGGEWKLAEKLFFNKRGAHLTAAAYHRPTGLLVAGFSNGIFEIFEMPGFSAVHTLSISQEAVTALSFNQRGDWLAVGCAALGQLLVWEWRSETYVLKQQGHYHDISTVAYSPDGAYIATGADDAKVKLWTPSNGFCFVTFAEHTAPITGLAFLPNSAAVVSSSLDGTVRAFDLIRYRNFRTMTSPTPQQFGSLAVDPSGEVVVAGAIESFQIFVWAVKTAKLLDILAAHEGPVIALQFSPTQPILASASWDKTVRTWDIFGGKGGLEVLQHNHDVLAIAFRPDGKLLASATLDGQIYLWNPQEAVIEGTIEGRRDIAGGRSTTDRRAAGNSTSGQCFTSLAFSADGSWLLAGGASKHVCLYDVAEKVMLRRFQISANRSLDGVLDQLNSKHITDAGPLDLIDDSSDEDDTKPKGATSAGRDLPGAGAKKRAIVRSRAIALSPAERQWAAATTEGLLLYSLDESLVFDPTDLGQDVTPQAVLSASAAGQHLKALLLAVRLRDQQLLKRVLVETPPSEVALVSSDIPTASLAPVLAAIAEALSSSPHLEFWLDWLQSVCTTHGAAIQGSPAAMQGPLRSLQRNVAQIYEQLSSVCASNVYSLQYLCQAGQKVAGVHSQTQNSS